MHESARAGGKRNRDFFMQKNNITKLVSRAIASATIVSMFAVMSPVVASSATNMTDVMSRQKASAATVTHTVTMTLPSDASWGTVIISYAGAGWNNFTWVSSSCVGGGTGDNGTAGAVLNVSTACPGDSVLTATFTGDNASGAGSHTATISGTTGVTGTYAVVITDDDQVTVSAIVDPVITFDLDVGPALDSNNSGPYVVALDTLTTGAVSSSGDGTINMIGLDLATNGTGGAIVTVKSLNSGLKSTSVPADVIPSVGTTLVPGTAGYGICVNEVRAGNDSWLAKSAFHNGVLIAAGGGTSTSLTCTSTVHDLTDALTSSPQEILNTNNDVIQGGRAEIFVKAAISGTTKAHTDYTDTLTFVATGAF